MISITFISFTASYKVLAHNFAKAEDLVSAAVEDHI